VFRSDIVDASHILHYNGIVDAFGHISVRHPTDSSLFIMSRNLAPALVAHATDLVEYKVSDASPVRVIGADDQKEFPRGFLERYIHSEIYKWFPSIHSVVHAHTASVLPFACTKTPLRAVFHMAGSIGLKTPVFDPAELDASVLGENRNMLIGSEPLGAALAEKFGPEGTANQAVVLMRGHGMTVVGSSIQQAVYRAIVTKDNAAILRDVLSMGLSDSLVPLSEREAKDAGHANDGQVGRPWALWKREVDVSPFGYSNILRLDQ